MTKIDDIRSRTTRTNGTRNLSQIKYTVRHHSATNDGNFNSFWNHWNGTLGWGTGGYHEIILRDGTVQLCYDPHEITNGVLNMNTQCYHICLVGNGLFTEAQETAWDERVTFNMDRLGIGVDNVKGHGELQSTTCPGINMNTVRSRIRNSGSTASRNNLSKDDSGPEVETLQENLIKLGYSIGRYGVDGSYGADTESAIKRFQQDNKLTVDGIYGPASKQAMEKVLKKKEGELAMQKEIDALKKEVVVLKQELAKKQDKPSNNQTPSPSHKEAWEWAEKAGLLDGNNPRQPLTRQQFATVEHRKANKN